MNKRVSPGTLMLAGLVATTLALPACPASPETGDVAREPGIVGDGGADGSSTAEAGPVDECASAPSAPECMSEDKALFVSAKGDGAGADGTKAKPLTSIGAALSRVSTGRKRIYICEGTYPEAIVLGPEHSGVSLLGGFDCAWQASEARPKVGAGPLALRVTGATVAVVHIAFEASDATEPGGASVGALVSDAAVTFRQVRLVAGKGQAGAAGTPAPFTYPTAAELKGKDASALANGAETAVTCPGDATTSTLGGAGGPSGFPGQPGTVGPANAGTIALCVSNTGGGNGQPGTSAPPVPGGAKGGTLTADGWLPQNGAAGAKGGAGQGGGGGAGLGGGHGGGGGAGGCGGAGGPGGQGGGASLALAAIDATIRLEASTLVASDAGSGGPGTAGQLGQSPGGIRGSAGAGTSCQGGHGGAGGNGGAGAGGAGGISIGVLYLGSPPELDAQTQGAIRVGAPGAAGIGAVPGPSPVGNDGAPGVAEKVQAASAL